MSILNRFSKNLTAIKYPKEKSTWNIGGIIKGQNAFYKFDVREMFILPDGKPAQSTNTKNKADKLVLEGEKEWLIIDFKELKNYVKKNKVTKVYVDDLIASLECTIILKK